MLGKIFRKNEQAAQETPLQERPVKWPVLLSLGYWVLAFACFGLSVYVMYHTEKTIYGGAIEANSIGYAVALLTSGIVLVWRKAEETWGEEKEKKPGTMALIILCVVMATGLVAQGTILTKKIHKLEEERL